MGVRVFGTGGFHWGLFSHSYIQFIVFSNPTHTHQDATADAASLARRVEEVHIHHHHHHDGQQQDEEEEGEEEEEGAFKPDLTVIPPLLAPRRRFKSACGIPDFTNFVQVRSGEAGVVVVFCMAPFADCIDAGARSPILTHKHEITHTHTNTHAQGFVETLDYILIEEDTTTAPATTAAAAATADVLSVARMPTREEAGEDVALPSWRTPSDHVSLLCDVRITW